MDINPQYTFDKNGNPVGVFISLEEWNLVSDALHIGLPEWQQKALDAEVNAIAANKDYLLKWDDVKNKILA